MAITPFILARAFVENAGAYSPTETYDFGTNDLNECTADMNYRIMSEAADMHDIIISTDEIITEAIMAGGYSIDVLHENVFATIKEGAIKFFNKIKSMIKGIIEILKTHFYKMTKKTGNWVRVITPRIESVMNNQPGYGEYRIEGYKWNSDYLAKDGALISGVKSLLDEWNIAVNSNDGLKADAIKAAKEDYRSRTYQNTSAEDVDADSKMVKDAVADLEQRASNSKTAREAFEKSFVNKVAQKFNVSGGSSLEVVWSDISKTAHGGSNEKLTHKISDLGGPRHMLTVVEKSGDALTAIRDLYTNYLKDIEEYTRKLNDIGSGVDVENANKIPDEVTRAIREAYKEYFDHAMKMTTMYVTASNSARQLHINLHKSMVDDYMTYLTKLSGYKSQKKK